MPKLKLVILIHFLFLASCVSPKKPTNKNIILESIPLKLKMTEPGKFVPEILVNVDGSQQLFMLDTGAVSSRVALNEHTKTYPHVGKSESRGASGQTKNCDLIQPKRISLGNHLVSHTQIRRCEDSLFGLDQLKNSLFQIDLKNKTLRLLKNLPGEVQSFSVRRLSPGHITIPINITGAPVDALFDTGADTTVIDTLYVQNNSDHFQLIRSEDGTDANGFKISSKTYLCSSIQIGSLKLQNVEVSAFDFGDFLRQKMEGSPIILGNNIISKAVWSFDLKTGHWTIEAN
jgi:predicted aspartyl protease